MVTIFQALVLSVWWPWCHKKAPTFFIFASKHFAAPWWGTTTIRVVHRLLCLWQERVFYLLWRETTSSLLSWLQEKTFRFFWHDVCNWNGRCRNYLSVFFVQSFPSLLLQSFFSFSRFRTFCFFYGKKASSIWLRIFLLLHHLCMSCFFIVINRRCKDVKQMCLH